MIRIVIIGGGFAGAIAAKYLEKDKRLQITLIDTKSYFEFTPGILRTIVHPEHFEKMRVLHSHYLKRSKIICGEVIELKNNSLFVKSKNKKEMIDFDYCLIASGSKYETPIKDYKLVIASRSEELISYHKKLESAQEVLIIGGGLVGVELAAEILDEYKDKKITMIDPNNCLMARQGHKAQRHVKEFLERYVKIVLEDKVTHVKDGTYFTQKGSRLRPDIAFFCTGIKPNFSFLSKNFNNQLDKNGRIKVNSSLQVENCKRIFAAGDICNINQEALAQNAEIMGRLAAKNIIRQIDKIPLLEYKPKPRVMVISLGKFNGLITYKKIVITGIPAAFMKWAVEKWAMFGIRN
ncbi:MAG: FAD-dependent oxidoreductase [Nanoarchaeota archaeon]|nr:FAD-dependent oxidoreductase [Nanoarchaeota archaeon]